MDQELLMLLPIIVPLAAGLIGLCFFYGRGSLFAFWTLLAVLLSAAAYVMIARADLIQFSHPWFGSFDLAFTFNPFKSVLMAFILGFQLMTALYLTGFSDRIRRPGLFAFFSLLAFAASAGVILTDSLLFLLFCWEIFLVALYAIIHSGGEAAEATSMKALIIGGAGDFLMILGLLLYFQLQPHGEIAAHIPVASSNTAFLAFFLLFLGAGAKVGMFPFHTWIPDASLVMPAPGFAALPASLEKVVGIYFLYLITGRMFELSPAARIVMYCFAVVTLFVTLVPALTETNLKKVLALTSIAPVGFLVAGMATSELAGFAGALMLMLTHASYKSAMFFGAGRFEKQAGSATLEQIEGIGRVLPFTATGFLMAVIAAIGLPPTGGFIGKDLIFEGLAERGQPVVLILLAVAAVLNVAIFCKIWAVVWSKKSGDTKKSESSFVLYAPVVLLGLAALMSGYIFMTFAGVFGDALGAREKDWIMAIWRPSPVMALSYGVYLFGFLLYFVARERSEKASATFSSLRRSPVLGRALVMAEEKKFDGYEIGYKVVHFIARMVFDYFERLIDKVVDWIIFAGGAVSRPFLSSIHNGEYGNYLAWLIVGLLLVTALIFRSVM